MASAKRISRPAGDRQSPRTARGRRKPGPVPYAAAIAALDAATATVALELDGETVRLTQLDKPLWPGTSELPSYVRRDYIRYLLRVAPFILAHLRDRPLTLIRHPDGVGGRRFVHFHYEQPLPKFVETVDIYSEKARAAEPYLLCNNVATLLWLAHVGCLEFHGWHSRASAMPDARNASTDYESTLGALEGSILNYPDYVVCDLDPYIYAGTEAKGSQPEWSIEAFERCKTVAIELRTLLAAMRLEAMLKTSGRTGLHVIVPMKRTVSYDESRALATALGRHLMAQHPELITMDQPVSRRTGKIFFDAGMNARVKTLSAPYSVRAAAGAPVSMPLDWDALAAASLLDYTMDTVPDILARDGDAWADVVSAKQDVRKVLEASAGEATAGR